MPIPAPSVTVDLPPDPALLEEALAALPNSPAVFLLWPMEGEPFLAKTALLRRRMLRLLRPDSKLRHAAVRIECWLTGSSLESMLRQYDLARRHFRASYRDLLRLRMPPYVKIVLDNVFPRSTITRHLSRAPALYFGPFRSRASAEKFEGQCLDLFQMRRCQEDLIPSPSHPGCIYGEMGMCLRPCQQVVGADEYHNEVERVTQFLSTGGRSLLAGAAAARDRFSQEQDFEQAARQHKRLEKIEEVLKLRDELARDIDRLHGVAVTRSADPSMVNLWFVHQGCWQSPRGFLLTDQRPMDERLRELVAAVELKSGSPRRRQEHLALLARWFYSTWRDGEWLEFDSLSGLPYRKVVRAISRVSQPKATPAPGP
ncbi:MAG: hypothetical protein HYR60_02760 [Acidobacteria bacterium]|nr:hypothetical protein [Acidobacteriota bacterium]